LCDEVDAAKTERAARLGGLEEHPASAATSAIKNETWEAGDRRGKLGSEGAEAEPLDGRKQPR